MASLIGWADSDIDIPTPERIWEPVIDEGFSPWLHRKWEDGSAFDQCFCCGLAMCEDAGDYVEWTYFEAFGDHGVAPDPVYASLCEDCAVEDWWDAMYEEDEDY